MTDQHVFDVVIVGSGAAGLTAAVTSAHRGLSVLVLESTDKIGGTTAYSGGAAWIPDNHHMGELGLTDTRDDAELYLRTTIGDRFEEDRVNAYLDSAPEMLRFIEANSKVRFGPTNLPDYKPGTPGARVGRTVFPHYYDARGLGRKWVSRIRGPLPGYSVFGSLQCDAADGERFKKAFRNPGDFWFSARRFLRYLYEVVRYGRAAQLANGNALIGQLLHSALDHGVEVWTSSPAVGLEVAQGRVTGVSITRAGKSARVDARCAVVMASGGFGGNRAMLEAHMPLPAYHQSAQPATNVGDGIALALGAGAALATNNLANGILSPVSVVKDRRGRATYRHPHFAWDRSKAGAIVVDFSGRRFANDALPYQFFVAEMREKNVGLAYVIADHRCIRRWGLGAVPPAPVPLGRHLRTGYLVKGRSIAELALKLSIDPATLDETLSTYNRHAAEGTDPHFHRGETSIENAYGDPDQRPNPNIRALQPPFYAIQLHVGDASTILGVRTSPDAQVLRDDESPIEGLYAVGLDQNSVMRGAYPGGGCSIGPGMTFAYRLAMSLGDRPAPD